MTRTTKIVLAVIAGVALLALVWFIAAFFAAPEESGGGRRTFLLFPSGEDRAPVAPGGAPGAGVTSQQPESKLLQLTKEPVTGATLAKDNSHILFYKQAGGNLFQIDLEGKNETKVSSLTILGIAEVEWAPTKESSIVAYVLNNELKYFIHAISTSSTVFLPRNISSAAWSPEGSRIAYTRLAGSGTEVTTAGTRGEAPRIVYKHASPDWRVRWTANTTLLLTTTPSNTVAGVSLFLPLGQGADEFISSLGLSILPASPIDAYAVFSTDGAGKVLPISLRKRTGDLITNVGVGTLAEKCSWSPRFMRLYCAIPGAAESVSGLPDEWYRGKVQFRDRIIRVNPQSGALEELLGDSAFDAWRIFTDPDEKFLFFTDRNDSTLWRLELK